VKQDVSGFAIDVTLCFERRVDCCARVDHDHISAIQEIREIEEPRVRDGIVADARHHQPHLIAREPAHFWRLVRCVLVGELEVEPCFERVHAASAAAGPSAEAE
jgi:hypothetical protein